MLYFKRKNKNTKNILLFKNKYWLFQTVFYKTSFTPGMVCAYKHRCGWLCFQKVLKMPLSKCTLASLSCKATHLMLFVHQFLT